MALPPWAVSGPGRTAGERARRIVVIYPSAANHVHEAKNASATHVVELDPDPLEHTDFFLLSAVSVALKGELPKGDEDYSRYACDYSTKWKSGVNGAMNVDVCTARWEDDIVGGGEISPRYTRAASDPALDDLWFLQLVTTNDPICKAQTGRPCGGLPKGSYIDPYRNDDPAPQNDPFYYHSGDKGPHYNGNNAFGKFDLHFYDFSRRDRTKAPMPKDCEAELHLSSSTRRPRGSRRCTSSTGSTGAGRRTQCPSR